MLLEGNEGIIRAIHTLKEAIQNCQFHGRDYYVQDDAPLDFVSYSKAQKERHKHLQAIAHFEAYILKHYDHISNQ